MSQQINLYNPLFEPRREWMSFNVAATTVLAVLGLIAVGSIAANWRYHSLVRQEQAAAQRLAGAKEEMTRLANQLASRQKDPQLLAELDRAQAELKSRDEVVAVLQGGALGNTAGYSEYLRAFARQSIEGLWLTGFSISGAGHHVVIEGRTVRADLVPDYLQRLNRERILQGSTFAEMQMQQPVRDPGDKKSSAPPYLEFKLATAADAGQKKGTQQ
jgi:hypothetical protein